MRFRISISLKGFLLLAIFAAPQPAFTQLINGRFYPEKQNYVVGEPVIVVLEIQNQSSKNLYFPSSSCTDLFSGQFIIENAPPKHETSLYSCVPGAELVDCLIGSEEVPAEGVYRKRLLLEGNFNLNSPGRYHVRGNRDISLHDTDRLDLDNSKDPGIDLNISSEFDIYLRSPEPGELEAAISTFLNDLESEDVEAQALAAEAIAQNPPTWTEPNLISMANDPFVDNSAILGLDHLGTPAARAKLWDMARTPTRPDGGQPEIGALGEIGNPEDCVPMLALARASKDYTQAEAYIMAGRICKEDAVGPLSSLLGVDNSQLLTGVSGGLANTASRDAVSPLIAMLLNPQVNARQDAADALEKLTHFESNFGVEDDAAAQRTFDAWTNWWSSNEKTAPIFGADSCAPPQPLPGTPSVLPPNSRYSRYIR